MAEAAKLPIYQYRRVPPVDNGTVVVRGDALGFAMIPLEVGSDPRLTAHDVRVYFALAGSRKGAEAAVGMRRIAKICRIGYRKIGKHLRRLEQFGHIEITVGVNGERARYRLTSPLFGEKQAIGAESGDVEEGKQGGRTSLKCGKCGQVCRGLLKVGWCRSCNWKLKIRHVVREEIAVARAAG
jgi:hypothetical protein